MTTATNTSAPSSRSSALGEQMEPLHRLSRDLKASAALLTPSQARWAVDRYYQIQEERIRADAQIRSERETEEPNTLLQWMSGNFDTLEQDIRRALDAYSLSQVPGRWARSIVGVGPVIAAGLLAHVDITKAPTAGHIWRFAGLDPTTVWAPKTKRPWNAALKVLLAYKLGESFVKVQNNERDVYGKVFAARKALEMARNDAGVFAEQAQATLATKRIGQDTDAYKALSQGRLPQAQIHARARRYAVKLFAAHYHHVAYEGHYGAPPPRPYVLEHLGHVDYMAPPNWPMSKEEGEEGGRASA